MVKTSKVFTKTRPHKEEKQLFPCKKDFNKDPAKKTLKIKAGRRVVKSEASTPINKKDISRYQRQRSSFHAQAGFVRQNSIEFDYSGKTVDSPANKIKKVDSDNSFFSTVEVQSTCSGETRIRTMPEGNFVVDGATGSELDRRGVDCSLPLWSANANLIAPEVLKDVHKHYLLNGAKAITTNTFRTHETTLKKVGLGHLAKELTTKAVEMAVQARDEVNPDALVLGCVAPLENCYRADLVPDTDVCKREHRKMMTNLMDAGCDFLLIETASNGKEAIACAEVA